MNFGNRSSSRTVPVTDVLNNIRVSGMAKCKIRNLHFIEHAGLRRKINNKKLLFVTQVKESTFVKENSVDYLLKVDEYY